MAGKPPLPASPPASPPTVRVESEANPIHPDTLSANAATLATSVVPAPALGVTLPRIPGYEVQSLLGRGGMGMVYLVRDEKLGRLVALKMLTATAALDPRMFERFETEVKAVARLQHPHIAQVYEAGDVGGQPYFTMEYVTGGSLAVELAGKPINARTAAGLMEPIARAMAYAHQQGVIHRDLKPANVLLGEAGLSSHDGQKKAVGTASWQPKVTDFGLAKFLDEESGKTRAGDVLGTPSYMAPEQAAGKNQELGPACDIYALGAILYELLAGKPPFQAPDPYSTVMQVITLDPVPPRTLQPGVPRDLETICLKCLAKSPAKRYADAHGLADDLGRFLAGEPIQARPTPWWERAWKWTRRHPAIATLLVLSLLSTGVIGLFYWSLTKAYREREASLWIAQEAVDKMLNRWGEDLKGIPEAEGFRQQSLEDAAQLFRALAKLQPNDERSEELAALARFRLGQIYRRQGKSEEADRLFRDAQVAFESLLRRWPKQPDYTLSLGNVHHGLGLMQNDLGNTAEAVREYQAELAILDTLTEPTFLARQSRGRCLNNLAIALRAMGKGGEAAQLHQQALGVRLGLHAEQPDNPMVRADLAASYGNVAVLLLAAKRTSEALANFQAAEELLKKANLKLPGERFQLGQLQSNLAASLERLQNDPAAPPERKSAEGPAKAFAEAVATLRKLVADYPKVPNYRFIFAQTLTNAGLERGRVGASDASATYLSEAIRELEKLCHEFPQQKQYRESLELCRSLLKDLGQKSGLD